MSNKNTEFLRAITGPKIEYNGSPVTRYSTWSIGGGLKVDENPFFNKLNLSVDDQHIIDLINQHGGGGGGDASLWAEYPATQDVDIDGHKLTGLGEPTNPQDAATKAYVDSQSGGGGGPTDRIESPSGNAFVESTDDYRGFGIPGSTMGAETSDSYARVYTWAKSESSYATVWAGPERGSIGGVGFSALYNTASDEHTLAANGAPLYVEEPTESYHAATKGYVDAAVSGSGGGGTPGHVICNVGEDDPFLEPVPQRANLIFAQGEGAEWEAMDFEELDATVLLSPQGSRLVSYGKGDPDAGNTPYSKVSTFATGGAGSGQGQGEAWLSTSDGIASRNSSLQVISHAVARGIRMFTSGEFDDLSFSMGYSTSFGTHIRFTGAPVSVPPPQEPGHAATKGYVDGIAGLAASIAEGELPLTIDNANSVNITSAAAGPLRYTRIGRTVTLSGLIQLTADSAGAATAAFTGISGAAAPATNNTWRGIISDQASGQTKNLNIMVYGANNSFRYTVVGAEAGASYRISFVMVYRSAA